MGKKPETKFKERVQKDLKKISFSHWTKIQQVALRGTPDIIGCIKGRFICIELKCSDKEYASALQRYELRQFELAGAISLVSSPETWDADLAFLLRIS